MIIWALNLLLAMAVFLLVVERLEGLQVTFGSAVYVNAQVRERVFKIQIRRSWATA